MVAPNYPDDGFSDDGFSDDGFPGDGFPHDDVPSHGKSGDEATRRVAGDGPDAAHQPAPGADLEAYPPADESCSEIRGLMRDYVDGDLDADADSLVESHVHECRPCALALSRAESEWMQITAALGEVDLSAAGPSVNFTEMVMQEVREVAVTQPSVGFTARVMARVRETALAEAVLGVEGEPAPRSRLPLYVLLAATVLFGTWIGVRLFEAPDPAVVEVVAARNAEMVRDGAVTPLVVTDHWNIHEHRATDAFRTGAEGELGILWKPGERTVSLRAGARSRLRVGGVAASSSAGSGDSGSGDSGSGNTGVGTPEVALVSGDLVVQSRAAVLVALRDGSSVRLGGGESQVGNSSGGDFWIHVEDVRHQDSRVGLRVKVEVRQGSARIVRGAQETAVAAGSQAQYTTFSPVAVAIAPGKDLFAASRRRAQDRAQPASDVAAPRARFFGQVLDPRNSAPVPGGTVVISTVFGEQRVTTDAEGRFRLAREDQLRGTYVALRVMLPGGTAASRELAPLHFQSVFLDEQAAGPRRVFLERAGTVGGRAHDANGRARPGLWVRPCVASSLFGTVVPSGPVAMGDAGGAFAVHGLPAESHPHRTLLLVAGGQDLRPRVVWVRSAVRVEDAVLDLTLADSPVRRLGGFGSGVDVQLLFAVRGIGLEHVVQARTMRADRTGGIAIELSAPVLVLRPDGAPRLVVPEGDDAARMVDATLPAVVQGLRTGDLDPDRLHWFGSHSLPRIAAPSADGGVLSVHEAETGAACENAQLFLRTTAGELQFLGTFDARVAVPCSSRAQGTLFAGTPRGEVGQLVLARELGRARKSIAVARPGRVLSGGGGRGVVVLQRQVRGGLPVPVPRPADASEWIVPAGSYRLGEASFTVEPGGTHSLTKR